LTNLAAIHEAGRRRILTIVGTRPQLIKAAALQPALRARHDEVLVDTGQHWDDNLAGTFFRELGLHRANHSLDAGGGTHAEQTASMLVALEPIVRAERPDAAVVFGDTNSTLAGALVAAKLNVPVAHVEAGLRSFDRRMPEEVNRVVADHLARWLFAPTPAAVANLAAEGIHENVLLVGDLMQDLAAQTLESIRSPAVLAEISSLPPFADEETRIEQGRYVFATMHRQENRESDAVKAWSTMLSSIARPDRPVILALHPGTRDAVQASGAALAEDVVVVEPLGYRTSLALQLHAAAVVTDSGGVQREASWLGIPCLVLRQTTEWTEALESSAGRMVLVGRDTHLAETALRRLAPDDGAPGLARERAATVSIALAGAADAIAETLAN
jgi:UDP-GlcNAc3NAcA epimerase